VSWSVEEFEREREREETNAKSLSIPYKHLLHGSRDQTQHPKWNWDQEPLPILHPSFLLLSLQQSVCACVSLFLSL
jgi:hypothetical protein